MHLFALWLLFLVGPSFLALLRAEGGVGELRVRRIARGRMTAQAARLEREDKTVWPCE